MQIKTIAAPFACREKFRNIQLSKSAANNLLAKQWKFKSKINTW
jgi:hypothetical protein